MKSTISLTVRSPTGLHVPVKFSIEVDEAALVKRLGDKAYKNKTGSAVLGGGAVKVRIIKENR